MSNDRFQALYDRGIAVGQSDISTDTMFFRYGDEKWEFPTPKVSPFIENSGYGFYTAPVDRLRELEREAAGG